MCFLVNILVKAVVSLRFQLRKSSVLEIQNQATEFRTKRKTGAIANAVALFLAWSYDISREKNEQQKAGLPHCIAPSVWTRQGFNAVEACALQKDSGTPFVPSDW